MEKRSREVYFFTLTGVVIMIFMLSSYTNRELINLNFSLFGFSFGLGLNAMEILIVLTAVMVDLGMYHSIKTTMQVPAEQIALHLFLPFAVTLTIGFTLRNIRGGLTGWGLLFIAGVLLYLVLRFEYISCDPSSSLRPLSIVVLDSLCYAVYLLFIIALRANVSRLIITIPAIFILCFVVGMKIYSFHIIHWSIIMVSAVTGAIICFADAGLHYWPVNIVSYGSLMFIWYYTLTNFVIGADRDEPFRKIIRRIMPADILAASIMVYDIIRR